MKKKQHKKTTKMRPKKSAINKKINSQLWYYLSYICGYKGVHIFPKDISPKVNAIERQELELVPYDITHQHISHYAQVF